MNPKPQTRVTDEVSDNTFGRVMCVGNGARLGMQTVSWRVKRAIEIKEKGTKEEEKEEV